MMAYFINNNVTPGLMNAREFKKTSAFIINEMIDMEKIFPIEETEEEHEYERINHQRVDVDNVFHFETTNLNVEYFIKEWC